MVIRCQCDSLTAGIFGSNHFLFLQLFRAGAKGTGTVRRAKLVPLRSAVFQALQRVGSRAARASNTSLQAGVEVSVFFLVAHYGGVGAARRFHVQLCVGRLYWPQFRGQRDFVLGSGKQQITRYQRNPIIFRFLSLGFDYSSCTDRCHWVM